MIDNVLMPYRNVPQAANPFHWNLGRSVDWNVGRLILQIDAYNPMAARPIDEAAVLTPNPYARTFLGRVLAEAGWDLFNRAEDLVFTNPFGTRYIVEYWFYRHPEISWRLEVMMLGLGGGDDRSGFSPLHSALWRPTGRPRMPYHNEHLPVPHLSYKVEDRGAFAKEQDRLRQWGSHAMTCQSTYGVFSYWMPSKSEWQLYLKPRANLRDDGEFKW